MQIKTTTEVLSTIFCCLSICGCFTIFFAHKFWRDVQSKSRDILLYITIADFCTATGYLLNLVADWKYICVVQSFFTTTSSIVSFFWTSCMALFLHAVSVNANQDLGKRLIFLFHCIAWPLPVLICIIALALNKLGPSCAGTVDWCWIKETSCKNGTNETPRSETVFWMLLAGKFWEIFTYIIIVVVYTRIYFYVREERKVVSTR